MSYNKQKLIDTLTTPAVAGVTAAIGCYMVHGSGIIPIFGQAVPASLAFGAVSAGASLLGATAFNYVAPHIPNNLRTVEAEKLMVKPVLGGLATYGLLKATANSDVDFVPNFAIGAVSELAAQQTANAVKSLARNHL